jgi:hypothetical protein
MESNRTVIDNKKIIAMKEIYKDASKVKYSSLAGAPDCESVNGDKQFDFSKFNEFFNDEISPGEFIESLQELRVAHLELAVCAYDEYVNKKGKMLPHEDIYDHVFCLAELIRLVKSIDKN